ncbi:MAG: hypothetical protein SNF68_03425 [Rikenellaceae bacterium]
MDKQRTDSEKRRSKRGLFWLLISGNVLLERDITRYYGQLIILASLFLLSIVVMFWSLHLDMQYNTLNRQLQLLRERSVRMQETRTMCSSHPAVVEELKRRNIDLHPATTSATVIEKRGFWR